MTDDKLISSITGILAKYRELQKARLFIFGSRALGKFRKFSDVDIGIDADKPVPLDTLTRIEEDFEQSDIPFTVDVVDFSMTNNRFKTNAMKNIIPIN